jgi:hypothetical protein
MEWHPAPIPGSWSRCLPGIGTNFWPATVLALVASLNASATLALFDAVAILLAFKDRANHDKR